MSVKIILIGVVIGLISAMVTVGVFKLIGMDLIPAVVGGVVGAVTAVSISVLAKKMK